jgi:hypothetical protein
MRRHSACGMMPRVAWEPAFGIGEGGRVSAAGHCAARDQAGGGFAAAHFPARRAGYGAAPPALRCCASRCARQPCGLPLTPGNLGRPWRQEERAGPGPSPGHTRHATPAVAGLSEDVDARESK